MELGYTRARRGAVRTLAVFIENMSCAQPEDFGTDIVTGFRQMAEPAGYEVRVIELNEALQKAAPLTSTCCRRAALGAAFGPEPGGPLAERLLHQPHPGGAV